MKIYHIFPFLIGILLLWSDAQGIAQNADCIQCNGCSVTGTNASAIGKNNTASGNNSFAGGYNSVASGSNSFAFGYGSKASQSTNTALGNTAEATGIGAIAIGSYVKASAQNSFVFGAGVSASYPLKNITPNSIAFGVNSNKPTLLITKALNNNYTGKVAIGPITNPQAKLHIKSDNNEDAGVFLEPGNKANHKAFINVYDANHSISVDKTGAMAFSSGTGELTFSGEHYSFGNRYDKKTRFYTDGNPSIYSNARRFKDLELREVDGTSYAIDFNDDALRFRTSIKSPERNREITNWKETLFLCTDGKIGIGSKNTFFENQQDKTLIVQSPNQLDINANSIKLTGKIGINTTNELADYALAVDGGIISTKVYIKEAKQWPDHVFSEDYPLMEFEELKSYLEEHKHLPGVPSETEVKQQGYDLHEMQYTLLEKIEEMTCYILALKEELDSLKANPKPLTQVQFEYDACGNRTSRFLTVEQLPRHADESDKKNNLPYDVYPNPTRGQFTIVIKEPKADYSYQATLLNSNGSIIEKRLFHGEQSVFDLSAHANGIYLLEIVSPDGVQTWKVVKQ